MSATAVPAAPIYKPTVRFLLSHPAHLLALGFGSGLSPKAPGTIGTLWAWLSFVVLDVALGNLQWALLLAASLPLGWWAGNAIGRRLGTRPARRGACRASTSAASHHA